MKIDNKERVFMIEFLKDRTEQIALKAIEHLKDVYKRQPFGC